MKIYILRHAKALQPGSAPMRDADRPLTPDGVRKMRRIAQGIKRLELEVDLILTSPYLRAKSTAELVASALKRPQLVKESRHLAADGDPAHLIAELRKQFAAASNVMLVGHQPYLGELIALLLSGETNLSFDLKKGGVAQLSVEDLKVGACATLEWLLTPDQLVQIGQAG